MGIRPPPAGAGAAEPRKRGTFPAKLRRVLADHLPCRLQLLRHIHVFSAFVRASCAASCLTRGLPQAQPSHFPRAPCASPGPRLPVARAVRARGAPAQVFHVDIHPAARIGHGILLDHATGVVIGETAVVGNNVSILHHVTLGGTGASAGDRHPKVGNGVLIGAGVTILGNISIGCNAKIGAGSVVLKDVPAGTTAVGVPARVLTAPVLKDAAGRTMEAPQTEPAQDMDQTSFINLWTDYII